MTTDAKRRALVRHSIPELPGGTSWAGGATDCIKLALGSARRPGRRRTMERQELRASSPRGNEKCGADRPAGQTGLAPAAGKLSSSRSIMRPFKVIITDHSFRGTATERELVEAAGGILEVASCR